jgi:hypothetical protein
MMRAESDRWIDAVLEITSPKGEHYSDYSALATKSGLTRGVDLIGRER